MAFARQESRRSGMDVASVLLSYGIISPQDYCHGLSRSQPVDYLQGRFLDRSAAVCDPSTIAQIVRAARIPASWDTTETRYAAVLPSSRQASNTDSITAVTTRQELGDSLRKRYRRHLSNEAALGLAQSRPEVSAQRRITAGQVSFALSIALGVLWCAYATPSTALAALIILCSFFFLSVILLRCLVLWPPSKHSSEVSFGRPLEDAELPTYSVLVPLYGEANMVPQLLDALCALDYPAALLDIKLILEESDHDTLAEVRAHRLPGCFEIILVPPSWPKTKPKALNFALPFACGDLLTIYDAEDIPDPGQLRMAAAALLGGPAHLACVQARLAFYNPNQNWLTRQFAIEYASLFDVTLPVLAAYGQPLPLGGTSNHFRTAVLRGAGGWDPFNVTEDADLGLRLDRLGYRVDVLDSTTFEEATFSLGNWLRQRSRWLKGWMQTWLVHMRAPRDTWRQMGPLGFAVFQVLMGGIVVSALVHPLFLIGVGYGVAAGTFLPAAAGTFGVLLFALQVVVLLLGYGSMMLIAWQGLTVRGLTGLVSSIPAMPIYWLLVSAAGWYALWQLVRDPHYWEKTEHGTQREPGS